MREITNINWNVERDFNRLIDEDKTIDEDAWDVSFDWNGYKLTARVSFGITFKTKTSGASDYAPEYTETVSNECELALLELFDEDFCNFKCDIKEWQEIQSKLLDELKVMV